ncbi:hypothetical protein EZV77_08790 [Burkholderia thailandensis]|nr:hypothetical protein [Burkholderia thailandensis]MDD1486756.1 hypothetical protein [Burkholderia thailandensis]MDD1492848.1 hypothetical protein [Burkholderia thailandensis]TBW66058.1 hypothetical protein EZV77_08790 [Burkholderia thailandensis]TGB30714.1 hypothetical protein C6946_27030 [Burkholderia thailandensis]
MPWAAIRIFRRFPSLLLSPTGPPMNGHVFTSQGRCALTSAHRRAFRRQPHFVVAERFAIPSTRFSADCPACAARIGPAAR